MSEQFARLLPIVWRQEGVGLPGNPTGFAGLPGDTGGATNFGITTPTLAALRVKYSILKLPLTVQQLSQQQAADIYELEYYLKVEGDNLPIGVALVVFDSAINQGVDVAIRCLQRALAVQDDGQFGPMTKQAVTNFVYLHGVPALVEEVLWQRLAAYDRVVKAKLAADPNTKYDDFLAKLWVPRLLQIRNSAKDLLA